MAAEPPPSDGCEPGDRPVNGNDGPTNQGDGPADEPNDEPADDDRSLAEQFAEIASNLGDLATGADDSGSGTDTDDTGDTASQRDPSPAANPFGEQTPFGLLFKSLGAQNPFEPLAGGSLGDGTAPTPSATAQEFVRSQRAGSAEPNVDPVHRSTLEQLSRAAELHVATVTGLDATPSGAPARLVPVKASEWVTAAMGRCAPLLDEAAARLAQPSSADSDSPMGDLMGDLMGMVRGPMLGALGASALTEQAKTAFGTYDLLLPYTGNTKTDTVGVVTRNLSAFASEWDLELEGLLMCCAVEQLTIHAVLSVGHVGALVQALVEQYSQGFQRDPGALERHLSEAATGDPEGADLAALQHQVAGALADVEVLLGATQTDAQRAVASQLEGLLALVSAYAGWVCAQGRGLVTGYDAVAEALLRADRRVAATDGFVADLLRVRVGAEAHRTAAAFVETAAASVGAEGLSSMWRVLAHLPRPDELAEPDAWLARIEKSGSESG